MRRARRRFAEHGRYEDPGRRRCCCSTTRNGWPAGTPTSEQLLAEARGGPVGRAAGAAAGTACRPPPCCGCGPTRDAYAAELARPMPRPPSRAARFGTRFHLWVERYFGPALATGSLGQQLLIDPDDLPDRGRRRRYGRAGSARAVRRLRGRAVRRHGPVRHRGAVQPAGRRPAGPRPDRRGVRRATPAPGERRHGSWWSTGRPSRARRPTRCSWPSTGWPGPRRTGLPPEQVDAVFYYVRTDRLVRPDGPGRVGPSLERLADQIRTRCRLV